MLFKKKPSSVGLALGGGAVRGFAHLGVLQVLQREGFTPSFIAGTSVGSLVGALLAAGLSADTILETARDIRWKNLVKPTVPKYGLLNTEGLKNLVNELVDGCTVEELPVPYKAVAVDISRGSLSVIDSGPVGDAVQASCSVPGIFEPVQQGDSMLVDGGVINNLPADILHDMGADYVIAVDLTADQSEEAPPAHNIFEVLITSLMRLMSITGLPGKEAADCLISPALANYSYHAMDQFEALVEEGKKAAEKALPQLKEAGVIGG